MVCKGLCVEHMVTDQKACQQVILEADFPALSKYSDDCSPRDNCLEVSQFYLSKNQFLVSLFYRFPHLHFIYFCSDLYDFLPSTDFGFYVFFFLSCFRYKVSWDRAQANKIRNENREVTTDTTEIQRIRDYCKQLYANKMDNLKEIRQILKKLQSPKTETERNRKYEQTNRLENFQKTKLWDQKASKMNSIKHLEKLTPLWQKVKRN